MIRVLVVDDHDLVRAGVCAALSAAGGIEVVGTCPNGLAAVADAARAHPDVIPMDLSMPLLGGVDATRQILSTDPWIRIVILTSTADGRQVHDALAAGAISCVFKDGDPFSVVRAVRHAVEPPTEIEPMTAAAHHRWPWQRQT